MKASLVVNKLHTYHFHFADNVMIEIDEKKTIPPSEKVEVVNWTFSLKATLKGFIVEEIPQKFLLLFSIKV